MTENEKQEIVAEVLASLKTNGRTIMQLTPVTTMTSGDYFELNGGRRVEYSVLYNQLYSAAEMVIEADKVEMWTAINTLQATVDDFAEVYCTEEEYNAMIDAGTIDPNTKYFIYES